MWPIIILIMYLVLVVVVIMIELYILLNNKGQYLKTSYKALNGICKSCDEKNEDVLLKEVNRFYEEYVQEDAQTKKYFPNVVVWLDAIIFRVDCENKHASILKQYEVKLKSVRDDLEEKNPFNKCEKQHQDILQDISKIITNDNEIVVRNIIKRTEEEFMRLTAHIKDNKKSNRISIMIGVSGIIVSIVMTFIKI